jgi:hypothetical protein
MDLDGFGWLIRPTKHLLTILIPFLGRDFNSDESEDSAFGSGF